MTYTECRQIRKWDGQSRNPSFYPSIDVERARARPSLRNIVRWNDDNTFTAPSVSPFLFRSLSLLPLRILKCSIVVFHAGEIKKKKKKNATLHYTSSLFQRGYFQLYAGLNVSKGDNIDIAYVDPHTRDGANSCGIKKNNPPGHGPVMTRNISRIFDTATSRGKRAFLQNSSRRI